MSIHKSIWVILPITVVTVVVASLFSAQPKDLQKNQEPVTQVNPTPEKIKILGTSDTTDQQPKKTEFDTQVLYRLISTYRKEHNLQKLSINKSLEESASRKLSDMIEKQYFRHTDMSDNESWYLFQASGYQYRFAGENLSSGNNTPWQVFDAWETSPKHNEQLLKPEYLDMGIAVDCETNKIKDEPICLVVLHLGTKE